VETFKGFSIVLDLQQSALEDRPIVPSNGRPPGQLTEADAIDIWIARWLRVRRKDLIQRYGCDPRRIYEIWEGLRFPASKSKAWALLQQRHPGLVDRVDPGLHRRQSRTAQSDHQPSLFDPKP
jgi:hypothetical protein